MSGPNVKISPKEHTNRHKVTINHRTLQMEIPANLVDGFSVTGKRRSELIALSIHAAKGLSKTHTRSALQGRRQLTEGECFTCARSYPFLLQPVVCRQRLLQFKIGSQQYEAEDDPHLEKTNYSLEESNGLCRCQYSTVSASYFSYLLTRGTAIRKTRRLKCAIIDVSLQETVFKYYSTCNTCRA